MPNELKFVLLIRLFIIEIVDYVFIDYVELLCKTLPIVSYI